MNVCHATVGTLGRVYDLWTKGILDLSHCNLFVIDEADKILVSDENERMVRHMTGLTVISKSDCSNDFGNQNQNIKSKVKLSNDRNNPNMR